MSKAWYYVCYSSVWGADTCKIFAFIFSIFFFFFSPLLSPPLLPYGYAFGPGIWPLDVLFDPVYPYGQ